MNRKGSACPGARTRGQRGRYAQSPPRPAVHQPSMGGRRDAQTPPIHRKLAGRPGISVLRPGTEVQNRPKSLSPARLLFAQGSPTRSPSPRSSPSLDAQEDKVALAQQSRPRPVERIAQPITPSPRSDRPTKSRRPRSSPPPSFLAREYSESPKIAQNRPRETPNRRRVAHLRRFSFWGSGITSHFAAMHHSFRSLRMKISPSEKAGEA